MPITNWRKAIARWIELAAKAPYSSAKSHKQLWALKKVPCKNIRLKLKIQKPEASINASGF
jgi:hypothetical protein